MNETERALSNPFTKVEKIVNKVTREEFFGISIKRYENKDLDFDVLLANSEPCLARIQEVHKSPEAIYFVQQMFFYKINFTLFYFPSLNKFRKGNPSGR